MSAPYSTAAIANWFLDRAERDKKPIDPMKLQKLIYFAHGWYLALTGKPLIDEHPEAWDYGPVIPSIYHEFKRFGREPITDRVTKLEPGGSYQDIKWLMKAKFYEPRLDGDEEVVSFLEQIWKVYGDLSAVQLANLSHVEGGAWEKAYKAASDRRGVDISDALIKQEFEAKKNRAAG